MNIRLGLMAWTAAVAVAAVPAAALAAVDAFIWFDGAPGNTKDPAHKGAFEIKDFSFGVENPTTIGSSARGAGAGKVKFNEFTIKKTVDSASPNFFRQALAGGKHFPTVRLEMRKAGGAGGSSTFLQYTFTNVFTTKVDWSGPGDEGPEESITFAYGGMSVHYLTQGSDRGGVRDPTSTALAPVTGLPPPGPNHPATPR